MLDDIGIEGVDVPAWNFTEENLKQLGAFGVAKANGGVSCSERGIGKHRGENFGWTTFGIPNPCK